MHATIVPPNPRLLPVLLLAALAGSSAHAEKADRAQPMYIEADALRHDQSTQTSMFSGRVVITKGTIALRGARVDLRQDDQGHQYGLVTGEAGRRAFFRQKRDTPAGAPEEFIEGESERIEYDGKADQLRFITRAELRRYRAARLNDEITGAVITYNSQTDQFTVDGQPAPASAAPAPAGRVRAVLAPRPAPASDAAPSTPPPVLRPGDSLGSDR